MGYTFLSYLKKLQTPIKPLMIKVIYNKRSRKSAILVNYKQKILKANDLL